jgi:purine-binding chemotaxis protein CheW
VSQPQTSRAGEKADVISQVERIHASEATCLFMRLGNEWYALPADRVEQVAPKGTITRVPRAPSHLLGIASLRGKLMTVVSLEALLGIAPSLPHSLPSTLPRLVVMKWGGDELAIVSDEIFGLDEYSLTGSSAPPAMSTLVRERFDWRGSQVSLLDIQGLFTTAREMAGVPLADNRVDA